MTNDENSVKRVLSIIDDKFCEDLALLLRTYDYSVMNTLASFVASLCDITVQDMFSSIDKTHISQARWLFWYSYRYITGESFDRIADRAIFEGHRFAMRSVAAGIGNMTDMIAQDGIWRKRWAIVKRFINAKKSVDEDFIAKNLPETKITLTVPKGTKLEIKEI